MPLSPLQLCCHLFAQSGLCESSVEPPPSPPSLSRAACCCFYPALEPWWGNPGALDPQQLCISPGLPVPLLQPQLQLKLGENIT